jgi:hypothetical protein
METIKITLCQVSLENLNAADVIVANTDDPTRRETESEEKTQDSCTNGGRVSIDVNHEVDDRQDHEADCDVQHPCGELRNLRRRVQKDVIAEFPRVHAWVTSTLLSRFLSATFRTS